VFTYFVLSVVSKDCYVYFCHRCGKVFSYEFVLERT